MNAPDGLVLVKDHVFPRDPAMIVGVVVGIGIGIGNAMLGVLFPSWIATLGLLDQLEGGGPSSGHVVPGYEEWNAGVEGAGGAVAERTA